MTGRPYPLIAPLSSAMTSRVKRLLSSLRKRPGYTLMRGAARFTWVRQLIVYLRKFMHVSKRTAFLRHCEHRMSETIFPEIDRKKVVNELREHGVSFGLRLPTEIVAKITQYAEEYPCYADRLPCCGFTLDHRSDAELVLGKPILVAQYFNTTTQCQAISQLARDPALQAIACEYLESAPTFVGANLWWTFPVSASEADRDRHAHLFHRDVDDFRFFKFFFYLTDVEIGDGAHVCVVDSHHRLPKAKGIFDRWKIRRYSDEEIQNWYPAERILEICGSKGEGFAENTLCIHKGMTPTQTPRLLLQLQFALFDYGAMHDRREPAVLRLIS